MAGAPKLKELEDKIFIFKALSASERDCERKILLKRRELINNGVDPESLRIKSLNLFQDNIEVQPTD